MTTLIKHKRWPRLMVLVIAVILSLACCLAYGQDGEPEQAKASVESSMLSKTYNVVYKFVNNHEYLLAPLSGFMAGMIKCNYKCGAVGGIAGIVDELLISLGYTDSHYLTWGIFGVATGQLLKPTMKSINGAPAPTSMLTESDIAGVIVGVLMPTGVLNNHKEGIAPVVAAIAGNSIAGTPGLIGGGVAGILDKVLLNKEIYSNHYLTFGAVGVAATRLVGCFSPIVGDSLGMLLGVIASTYEQAITDNIVAPVKAANDLYTTYNKFIPKEQLDSHIEEYAVALVGSQFFIRFLSDKISNYRRDLINNFERLDTPGNEAWDSFQKEITNFAIFLFPYAIGQTLSGSVGDYFDKKLRFVLEDRIRTEVFTGEIPLQLSQDPKAAVLMDNLKSDISTMVESGSGLMTGAISAAINGAYGVGIIIVNSPNIFVYSTLYNKAHTFVAEYLAQQRRIYGEKILALDSKLVSTMKHDAENIRTITERDGVEATRDKIGEITTNIRELEGAQKLWGIANNVWWSTLGTADYLFNYYLIANEINYGRIPFANRGKVQEAGWQVLNLLSWPGRTAQDMAHIRQSLDRIVVLEGKIYRKTPSIDQIHRIRAADNSLVLRDITIGVDHRPLVSIENLQLEMGKIYGLTGESGCGKTSLLSKIKGIKENNIAGKGYIYYPQVNGQEPKVVMLSQQDYFPLDASLYEILVYPDNTPKTTELNKSQREAAQFLLKKVGLYGFSDIAEPITVGGDSDDKPNARQDHVLTLESKKNWYTYLSGGEKKKITIVSAILKKPDILILDEVFNGLDRKSTRVVQQLLKEHLPNSLILVVDHHAQDNNYGFYDWELRFSNKKVGLHAIPLRNFGE